MIEKHTAKIRTHLTETHIAKTLIPSTEKRTVRTPIHSTGKHINKTQTPSIETPIDRTPIRSIEKLIARGRGNTTGNLCLTLRSRGLASGGASRHLQPAPELHVRHKNGSSTYIRFREYTSF